MDRMHDLGPAFIDITWGAGGRHSTLTLEMVKATQSQYGLETCMHLTCTDMERSQIDEALRCAYKAGCTNILALRGDPPRDQDKWEVKAGGFRYAKDLVKYIKANYGDHFDIGVAGYSEGCDDHRDVDLLVDHLKEKSMLVPRLSSPRCFMTWTFSSSGWRNAVLVVSTSPSFRG